MINYTWSCHLVGEELPDPIVTSDPPESREAYEGRADKGGCWGEGPSWLTNKSPNLTILVDVFRSPNKTYSLQVIVSHMSWLCPLWSVFQLHTKIHQMPHEPVFKGVYPMQKCLK